MSCIYRVTLASQDSEDLAELAHNDSRLIVAADNFDDALQKAKEQADEISGDGLKYTVDQIEYLCDIDVV